jgi:hypothetical protein
LVVKLCEDQTPLVAWQGLLSGRVDRFIADNPRLDYVEVHLPSLRVALARGLVGSGDDLLSFDRYLQLRDSLGVRSETATTPSGDDPISSALEVFLRRRDSEAKITAHPAAS